MLRSAAFLLICLVGAASQASAGGMPVYAPVKERVCGDCALPKPGVPLPRHAVVTSSWGFFSFGSNFQVLDLDSGKLVRSFVPAPSVPTHRAPRSSRSAIRVPPAAMPEFVDLANRIWAEPQAIASRDVTDLAWDLWLIDGRQIRHETGVGLPTGLAAQWMRRLNRLQGAGDPALDELARSK